MSRTKLTTLAPAKKPVNENGGREIVIVPCKAPGQSVPMITDGDPPQLPLLLSGAIFSWTNGPGCNIRGGFIERYNTYFEDYGYTKWVFGDKRDKFGGGYFTSKSVKKVSLTTV